MADLTAVHVALRTRLVTLDTLPAARAWTNKTFVPVTGTPYIEEEFVPGTAKLRGLTSGGVTETTGLYVIRWYGVANTGLGDLSAGVDALVALFAPGTQLTLDTGDVLHIRSDVAPIRSAILNDPTGWSICTVKIGWRLFSSNVVSP